MNQSAESKVNSIQFFDQALINPELFGLALYDCCNSSCNNFLLITYTDTASAAAATTTALLILTCHISGTATS